MARILAAASAFVFACEAAPTKVLPLGDSIAFGCGDGCNGLGCGDQCVLLRPACQAGWRAGLWRRLAPNSTTSEEWDFVGTQKNGPDDIDRDHEGHPVWTIEKIDGSAKNWIPLQPDVILLGIGTNNLGIFLQNTTTALGHMSSLLSTTFDELPKVRLLLSTLIGAGKDYGGGKHAEFNDGLKALASQLKAAGRNIELVDMAVESGIGANCDSENCCPFGIHPNAKGYDLMAGVWHSHLVGKSAAVVV